MNKDFLVLDINITNKIKGNRENKIYSSSIIDYFEFIIDFFCLLNLKKFINLLLQKTSKTIYLLSKQTMI